MFPQHMFRSRATDRKTFREACFLNNVSAAMFRRFHNTLNSWPLII